MSFGPAPNAPRIGPWPGMWWTVGTDRVRGQPFEVPLPNGIAQHVTLLGVTGSGKTTTAEQLAQAALVHGLSVVIVDAKGGGLRRAARAMAARVRSGVPYCELVPSSPETLAYNPCAGGSRSQVADKLVSAFAHGPNAEIYRVIAQEAIAVLVGVLRALGEPVTVRRLRQELDRARMAGLAHRARTVAPQLAADLADLGKRSGVSAEALDGMRARLGALLHGEYGELFERDGPQLNLHGALAAPGVTYISLPALAVTKDTALMARVLIQDLKQAAHQRLHQAPVPSPALLVLDEFAALEDPEQIGDLLRQAREAGVAVLVSSQHLPDAATAYALRAALLGAGLLIAHRCGAEDAEAVAAVIGTEKGVEVTRQVEGGANTGLGSVRRVDRYIVNPNAIKQLATGEAVVLASVGERRVATVLVASPPPAQVTP